MKQILGKAGIIRFDGVEWFPGVNVETLLETTPQDATGKAVNLVNSTKIVTLHDVLDDNGNCVVIKLTLRAERSPMSQGEIDLINRKQNEQAANAAKKDAKEASSLNRLVEAVQNTAIKVAQQSMKADPMAEAVQNVIKGTLARAFGAPALTDGK